MANDINALLSKMWTDYVELNPQAQKIVDLIESKGDKVLNDHIALRTFNNPRVSIDIISKPLLASGYVKKGDYTFEEKKLKAKHFAHPDENMPLIFISELLLEEFSSEFQTIANNLVESITDETIAAFDFMSNGKPWDISSTDYETLKSESDYGAWVSAIGYKPNHFTVYVNNLSNFPELADLNTFLKNNGFKLNSSGGEIKGNREVFLEQSSTLADSVDVEFTDKTLSIASCFFEFAKRYPQANGELYRGFVAASADKIFESTSKTQ